LSSAFVVLPFLRAASPATDAGRRRPWFGLLAGVSTMAAGLGAYAFLGQPQIALSALTGPSPTDYPALITQLARQMPGRPGDVEGWTLLGRGYLALGNAAQSEKALARAVEVSRATQGFVPPALLASYGEAITEAAGQVTKEAEAAFRQALTMDPKDLVSRYFVGLAQASRGDTSGALQVWEAVLADAPPETPWRRALVDQVAALRGASGGAAPNPAAMVAQLAARLESNPNDLEGWLRLIRAYAVLGDATKAGAALVRARTIFANQAPAQEALAKLAADNSLN
jgi:cytochrome c-type biogenesis protein CcmH